MIPLGRPVYNAINPPRDHENEIVKGTIGGKVYGENGQEYLLTCFHCIKNPALDYAHFRIDNTNNLVNIIDEQYMELTHFGQVIEAKRDNRVDVALIQANYPVANTIPKVGKVNDKRILTNADKGRYVLRKYGQISKYTEGTFLGISDSIGAPYGTGTAKHFFDQLIAIASTEGDFAVEGDSGAFVLSETNDVVGIIVIVDRANRVSYAIPIEEILTSFTIPLKIKHP
ncbi:hypothetical protein [Olivibacter jilunii]|uniref:hypothetical protein n=1 Tax=Olivibacter jilunii TaxID=985016 RepID=UPI0010301E66|nr:hypothetical protein [Olivibacter jilunii]